MATSRHLSNNTGSVSEVVAKPSREEPFVIDARPLSGFLVDLPDGATRGLLREHEGITEVLHEIVSNQGQWGAKAAVSADEVAVVVQTTDEIAKIRATRPAVAKLLEMLDETEAALEDKRETVIRMIADSVDAKARTVGETLRARYDRTRAYRSAAGLKAARTRKRNAEARSAASANVPSPSAHPASDSTADVA